MLALQKEETKEAIAIPVPPVQALELFVVEMARSSNAVMAFFSWWILVMICASMRFDDATHVAPTSLEFTEEALLGVVWQTNIERRRHGAKFAAANASLSGAPWLEEGWEVCRQCVSGRDFFAWEISSRKELATYARSLLWMRYVFTEAHALGVKKGEISPGDFKVLLEISKKITCPSLRVTFLDAAVHHRLPDREIGV